MRFCRPTGPAEETQGIRDRVACRIAHLARAPRRARTHSARRGRSFAPSRGAGLGAEARSCLVGARPPLPTDPDRTVSSPIRSDPARRESTRPGGESSGTDASLLVEREARQQYRRVRPATLGRACSDHSDGVFQAREGAVPPPGARPIDHAPRGRAASDLRRGLPMDGLEDLDRSADRKRRAARLAEAVALHVTDLLRRRAPRPSI